MLLAILRSAVLIRDLVHDGQDQRIRIGRVQLMNA